MLISCSSQADSPPAGSLGSENPVFLAAPVWSGAPVLLIWKWGEREGAGVNSGTTDSHSSY